METKKKTCNCNHCQRSREFAVHIKSLKDAGMNKEAEFFQNLYGHLVNVELDSDVDKSIIAGTWPQADAIIKQTREQNSGQSQNMH